ncbi:MAG: hypothetical protein AAGA28_18735 [Pseudomonadota bacterium]
MKGAIGPVESTMRFLLFFIALTAAALVEAVHPVAADDSDVWQDCRSDNSCTIEYDHLSDQKSEPFRFIGRVVDEDHPRWGQYRKAIQRYPDVRTCLTEEEKDKQTPNLLVFDWRTFGFSSSAEVCIFRIASSLGSPDRFVRWLDFHNFSHSGLHATRASTYEPRHEYDPFYRVTGFWTVEQFREVQPSWFAKLTGIEMMTSYSLNATFSKDLKVSEVSTGGGTILN